MMKTVMIVAGIVEIEALFEIASYPAFLKSVEPAGLVGIAVTARQSLAQLGVFRF